MGPAGLVTWVGNPRQTAEALLKLYREPSLRQRMGQAGQERVKRYYDQKQLLESYAQSYQMAAAQSGRERVRAGR